MDLIAQLPYGPSFLFADEIIGVNDQGISGTYTFKSDAAFYADHFPGNPVTPGVILIECMAQIGLVCQGIYLMSGKSDEKSAFAFTSSNVEFYKTVLPGEKVLVNAKKIYFRLGKLKSAVEMYNLENELVAKGEMSGMMIKTNKLP